MLGISLSAVKKHVTRLYKEGQIAQNSSKKTRPQREQIKNLRNSNEKYTNQEIADMLGISVGVVADHIRILLKRNEIEPRVTRLNKEQIAQIRKAARSPKTEAVARWLNENKTKTKWSSL